jgi:hypothetical protein
MMFWFENILTAARDLQDFALTEVTHRDNGFFARNVINIQLSEEHP